MSCERCRHFLLEADSSLIRRALATAGGWQETTARAERPETPHADAAASDWEAHLGGCPDCRRLATLVLDQEERLAHELSSLRAAGPVAETAARAAAAARRRARGRRTRAILTAAAVAGGVIGLGVMDRETIPEPAGRRFAALAATPVLTPEVEAGEGQSVAVFAMEEEDVVVFWFYEGGNHETMDR